MVQVFDVVQTPESDVLGCSRWLREGIFDLQISIFLQYELVLMEVGRGEAFLGVLVRYSKRNVRFSVSFKILMEVDAAARILIRRASQLDYCDSFIFSIRLRFEFGFLFPKLKMTIKNENHCSLLIQIGGSAEGV
jgi:hypothetical protein